MKEKLDAKKKEQHVFTLRIEERNALLTILPTQGHYYENEAIDNLKKILVPSLEERRTVARTFIEGNKEYLEINTDKDKGKEIDFGEICFKLIAAKLRSMETDGKLPLDLTTVYRKMILGVQK